MSEKITKTETSLTLKSLEDSGIKTQISQSDLIDIVVQDRHEKIQIEVNSINEISIKLQKRFTDFLEIQKSNFLKELQKVDPSVMMANITLKYANQYNGLPISKISFKEDSYAKTDNIYELKRENLWTLPGDKEPPVLILQCSISGGTEGDVAGLKGITYVSRSSKIYTKEIKVPAKAMASFYRDRIEFEKICDDFLATFPNPRINLNKLARDTKVRMNKAILKNQSPALQEQMKRLFAIDL